MITLSVDDQQEVLLLMQKMLTDIDPRGTHLTANNMDEAFGLLSDKVQIIFLDIEMPGLNGIEAARLLQKKYPYLNVIFVTGHPEYSLSAHDVFPSGFLTKPVDEQDIRRAISHLRFPVADAKRPLRIRCSPFTVFVNGIPFDFKSIKTSELFAYLVYKNGAFCSNGELLGVLWDGNNDKSGRLRQLIMDMRSSLEEAGVENVVLKKYGRTGIDMSLVSFDGKARDIISEFNWY